MDNEVSYIRENIGRGFNHLSLILCKSIPKIKKIVKENNIDIPENIHYLDFNPPISQFTNHFSGDIKQRYFISFHYESKGADWCSRQIGIPVDDVKSIARKCRVKMDEKKKDDVEPISLHEYVMMNHEKMSYEEMAERVGKNYYDIRKHAEECGIKKKKNTSDRYWRVLHHTKGCRILLFQMEDDQLKADLLRHLQMIDRFIHTLED